MRLVGGEKNQLGFILECQTSGSSSMILAAQEAQRGPWLVEGLLLHGLNLKVTLQFFHAHAPQPARSVLGHVCYMCLG